MPSRRARARRQRVAVRRSPSPHPPPHPATRASSASISSPRLAHARSDDLRRRQQLRPIRLDNDAACRIVGFWTNGHTVKIALRKPYSEGRIVGVDQFKAVATSRRGTTRGSLGALDTPLEYDSEADVSSLHGHLQHANVRFLASASREFGRGRDRPPELTTAVALKLLYTTTLVSIDLGSVDWIAAVVSELSGLRGVPAKPPEPQPPPPSWKRVVTSKAERASRIVDHAIGDDDPIAGRFIPIYVRSRRAVHHGLGTRRAEPHGESLLHDRRCFGGGAGEDDAAIESLLLRLRGDAMSPLPDADGARRRARHDRERRLQSLLDEFWRDVVRARLELDRSAEDLGAALRRRRKLVVVIGDATFSTSRYARTPCPRDKILQFLRK
jgi:hypothetical protein